LLFFDNPSSPWIALTRVFSLHELSVTANTQLAAFVEEYNSQYQINVLYVDFYEESKATDLAISLNWKNSNAT